MDIATLLKSRIEASNNGTLQEQLKLESKDYNKKWADAVEHFRKRINKQRKKEKLLDYSFIVIRQKLAGVKEIDDLRWLYGECIKYENKRDKFGRRIKENSFNKCFFGSLRIIK